MAMTCVIATFAPLPVRREYELLRKGAEMNADDLPPCHPAAEMFPPLDDASFQALVKDIQQNGQLEPFEFLDGKLLDGRNRYLACQELGLSPLRRDVVLPDGVDAYAYVVAKNLSRRQLTKRQRAFAAARYLAYEQQLAKERQRRGKEKLPDPEEAGQARDHAGRRFGVSGKTVDKARTVVDRAIPELLAMTERGEVPLSTAVLVAAEPAATQKSAVDRGPYGVLKAAGRAARRREKASAVQSAEDAFNKLVRSIRLAKGSPAVIAQIEQAFRQFVADVKATKTAQPQLTTSLSSSDPDTTPNP
jgi:ParB-like chromosome segregation protein Spo0J